MTIKEWKLQENIKKGFLPPGLQLQLSFQATYLSGHAVGSQWELDGVKSRYNFPVPQCIPNEAHIAALN
jgi:hypothetical protein